MRNLQNSNVIAFLMPHIITTEGDERDIEELICLDFLTALLDDVQEAKERRIAQGIW